MKEERAKIEPDKKASEVELCKAVIENMGMKGDQAYAIFKDAVEKHLQQCREYSDRCNIKLTEINEKKKNAEVFLADLKQTNKYHYKMSEQTTLFQNDKNHDGQKEVTGNGDEDKGSDGECTPEMIDAYLKELKRTGKLKIEPESKKPKIAESRRKV